MLEIMVSGLIQGISASRIGAIAIFFAFLAITVGFYGRDSNLGLIGFVTFGLLSITILIWGFISFVSGWIKEEKNNKKNSH